MPQEIFNEGRVVGLSAWEIFVKQALSRGVDPIDIPSETKWLTSMLGCGASMILNIPSGTTAGVHDFELPEGSNLSAAGVVVASPFIGSCEWDSDVTPTWAMKVTSYGPLIQNNASHYPSSVSVPPTSGTVTYPDSEYSDCVAEFIKLVDGIVYLKNATWRNVTDTPPQKDIDPNFNNSTTAVRLYLSSELIHDVKIILTGFSNKRILQTLSGFASGNGDGSADTDANDWVDGGMLGPEVMPWSSKIVFTVPSSLFSVLNTITRTIPSGITSSTITKGDFHLTNLQDNTVKSSPIIDFDSINLAEYYIVHENDYGNSQPVLQEYVSDVLMGASDSCSYLVAWYPAMSADEITSATDNSKFFPPALYASKINSAGEQVLVPLDTSAPGTVKCFPNATQAYNYSQLMPYNYSIYYNPVTNNYNFVNPTISDPTQWSGTAKIEYPVSGSPIFEITAGDIKAEGVALTYYDNQGVYHEYSRIGANGTYHAGESYDVGGVTYYDAGEIKWGDLLHVLSDDYTLDLLGTRLKSVATELRANPDNQSKHTLGLDSSNHIDYIGSRWVLLNPGTYDTVGNQEWATNDDSLWIGCQVGEDDGKRYLALNSGETPGTIRLGENFIRFNNGLKLYISSTEPDPATETIPVGSIGIGWVNS